MADISVAPVDFNRDKIERLEKAQAAFWASINENVIAGPSAWFERSAWSAAKRGLHACVTARAVRDSIGILWNAGRRGGNDE